MVDTDYSQPMKHRISHCFYKEFPRTEMCQEIHLNNRPYVKFNTSLVMTREWHHVSCTFTFILDLFKTWTDLSCLLLSYDYPPSLGLVEFQACCCPGYKYKYKITNTNSNTKSGLDCILVDSQITVAKSDIFGIICKAMI